MQDMTQTEYREFMQQGTRTGKLATVRADGRPHVAPIWFILDGEDLIFTTYETTVKAANLHRDPRASLCVDDEKPPFAFAIVEGIVEVTAPTPEDLLTWTTAIARRYMGVAQADAYGRRNAVEGELLVRLRPEKIVARKELAA
jgi:PPOX class probable F420-dependent enzyme